MSAFRWVPPFAQGLVREFRVRWALEEAGLPYEERLLGPEDQPFERSRRLQPFGQVFFPGEEWSKLRRPGAADAVKGRLADLAGWLEGREYLEERFTAGDLLMTTVLRILRHTPPARGIPGAGGLLPAL